MWPESRVHQNVTTKFIYCARSEEEKRLFSIVFEPRLLFLRKENGVCQYRVIGTPSVFGFPLDETGRPAGHSIAAGCQHRLFSCLPSCCGSSDSVVGKLCQGFVLRIAGSGYLCTHKPTQDLNYECAPLMLYVNSGRATDKRSASSTRMEP